jgi:hypothetical protein
MHSGSKQAFFWTRLLKYPKIHTLHARLTIQTPHFTLHILHSTATLYTSRHTSALHILHSSIHSTLPPLHSTLHTEHFTHSTLYTRRFTFYTSHSTLYAPPSSHSTGYNDTVAWENIQDCCNISVKWLKRDMHWGLWVGSAFESLQLLNKSS